eukprot:3265994-Amphidinium_carterae.1
MGGQSMKSKEYHGAFAQAFDICVPRASSARHASLQTSHQRESPQSPPCSEDVGEATRDDRRDQKRPQAKGMSRSGTSAPLTNQPQKPTSHNPTSAIWHMGPAGPQHLTRDVAPFLALKHKTLPNVAHTCGLVLLAVVLFPSANLWHAQLDF